MAAYFSNFPTVRYKSDNMDGTAKNIMLRGILRDEAKRVLVETIEIKPTDRADYISHLLYETPEYDYMLYLMNDIIDPYYEWYMTQEQLSEYLNNKYGETIDDIKYWKAITTNNSLAAIQIRDPGNNYVNNDIVFIGINRPGQLASARITTDNANGIINFTIVNPGKDITNPDNIAFRRNDLPMANPTATIIPILEKFNGQDLIINTETYDRLPNREQIKYESVTNREYEVELNEQHRLFNAVRPEVASAIQSQLKKLLNGQGRL